MAELNPLAFKVAVQDEATGQLNKIEQQFEKLKDKTISVKVEGLSDLQNLLSALQHQQVQNLGKDVASGIHDAAKGLQEEAQKAVRASLGKLAEDLVAVKTAIQHDNFSAFTTRIEKCAEAVNTLDAAFKQFHVTIGSDAGMKNFMTGLGEVIRNVRTTMGTLQGSDASKITPDAMARSFKVAKHEAERLQNELVRAQRTIETFGDKGFNVASLERYKMALLKVRDNLDLIKKNGGMHPLTGLTASQYLSSEDASRVVSLMKTELSYYQNIGKELERIAHLRSTLTSVMQANPSSPYRGELFQAIAGLDLREGLLARQGARDATQTLNSDAYRQQIQEAVSLISKVSAESRNSAKENAQMIESMRRAGIAVSDLAAKFDRLEIAKIRANAVAAKVDTTAYDQAVERMERYKRVLDYIAQHGGHDAGRITGSVGYRNAANDLNVQATALRTLTTEANKAAHATQQLSAEEQRLSQALQQTNDHARGQSQLLSDLKSLATQYLGVWGGQQFLHNIIEIGGQLEMQRLSIGAILQNTSQANELFDKIKGLATQSPFGVVQLDQMTKQLTAYGFKYNELYDMTKRLADISAATGTDVSRLALALGHVRSEAALSGYTLRQFSMANVPLLQKLSEKLGKTTKEIRDMVKKKEVGYDDVIGVLKDLTNEGGMFYNMQEVISESVKAKFKNVRDAMDIMYGEMAEGAPGDALKEVANVLMEVTKNWKDAATILGTGAAVWGIHRAAIMLYTKVLGQANYTTLAAIANSSKQVAMNNTLAWTYRSLTASEKSHTIVSQAQLRIAKLRQTVGLQLSRLQALRIAQSRREIVMGLAVALSEKKLVAEDISRQVALGKVTKAEALRAIGLSKLSAAEKAAAVQMVNNTRILGFWGKAGYAAALGIRAIGTALKSLVFNPAMMAMAAITAIMELWQRNSREMEAAEELSNKIYEHSQESLKNTRTMMESTGIHVKWREDDKSEWSDVTGSYGNQVGGQQTIQLPKFETTAAEQSIEQWSQYIRDYAATPNRILNEALFDSEGKVRSLKEQFDNLGKAVIQVAEAQRKMQSLNLGDAFGNAITETDGGWFDDNIMTDIADYDKKLKKFGANVTSVYRKYRQAVDSGIRAAERQDATFAEATKGLDTYAQKFKFLVEHQKEYINSWSAFRNVGGWDGISNQNALSEASTSSAFRTGFDEVNEAKAEMQSELNDFFLQLEGELEMRGIDKKKIQESEALQQALLLSYKDKLSSIQGLSEETANELMKLFAQWFGIKLDVDDEKFKVKVSEVQRILKELSDSEWNVDLNFASNVNDVIAEARKQYKAAKEFYENAEPVLIKFGVKMKMGDVLSEEKIKEILAKAPENARGFLEQVLKGANEASKLFNQSTTASKTGGFSLEDKKDKKKGSGNKKTGGTKSYKDEFAKRWDERIRIMKEAYSWYDKWEKKVGNDEAIKETNAKYADIFKEWRTDKLLPMDFDVNEIADYTKYVEKIRDDALKRYQAQKNDKGKNNGQEALRVYRQAVALLNDVKFDNFAKAAEEFRSIIEQTLEDLNERWDIFDAVRNNTGDVSLATRIAGFGAAEVGARTSADAMRNELTSLLQRAGGENLLSQIPLDIHLDEKGLRTMLEDAIPQADDAEKYKEQIDGLIKAYQEWQKLQRKVIKDDVNVFANLIGSAVSYDAQVKKLQDKLKQQKDSNNASVLAGTISQADADKANEIAQAQYDWEKMKLSADYANIYNNAIAMSREEFDAAAAAVERMLEKLRELELISPNDYVAERDKLNKARNEWSTTGFLGERGAVGQFISGGYDGLMNYYAERRDKARQQEKNAKPGSDEQKRYASEAEHYGKLFEKMSKLSDAAKDVITAFNTLQSGLDLLSGMFDSLGMEGAANATGDAAGVLGGAMQGASALSALGPWGMAAGAGLGLISGLAQVHDKALERQIGKLREDVQKIEANTKLIEQARERTLGFDTGDLRRSYAQDYAPNQTKEMKDLLAKYPWLRFSTFLQGYSSKAQKDMYEYYGNNSSGTGYQQEYQNLLDQRKDYLEILDKQESKKKKSQSDIEETKSKIAELDDQIRYFTQDLAKELFDIDIKGWADQLSDALSSAFENGESMAKAYKETVTSILQQVMNKMLQLAILEPMFQSLQDKLFGNAEKNISGVFDPNDPKGSMGKVTAMITDFFGKGGEGERTITAAQEFMTAFQRGVQNAGLSVLNESSNTLSSGVQGTSEETSDLLAGYVNALRQDVAIKRILLTQFVTELWPSYIEQVSQAIRALNNIDTNVAAIRALLSENGTLYLMIDSMRSHFDNITNGNEQVNIH